MRSFQFIFFLIFILFVFFDYLYSPDIESNKNTLYNKSDVCAPCGAPCEINN